MLASFKALFLVAVCCSTSGCLLPVSIGLLSKPIGYLIDQHMEAGAEDTSQPISVSAMLANARGDEPSPDANSKVTGQGDTCLRNPKRISVQDLLTNARSGKNAPPDGPDLMVTPIATNAKATATPRKPVSHEQMTVVMGTLATDRSPPPVFKLFQKAQKICKSLGDECDPTAIRMDPTLPLGTLQISNEGGAQDA